MSITSIIVEDGTNISGANSYLSVSDLIAYAKDRQYTFSTSASVLLIKAMDYIESLSYRGTKLTRNQGLQWPRFNVVVDGYCLETTSIPIQLKNGLAECAIAIDQGTGPQEDLQRKTTFEKVGDLEVHYSESSSSATVNRKVRESLRKLLSSGGQMIVNKG